jgi:hypothetical protein
MEEPGISKIVSVKVRSGEESLPGGNSDARSQEEAVSADETPEKTTDTVSA